MATGGLHADERDRATLQRAKAAVTTCRVTPATGLWMQQPVNVDVRLRTDIDSAVGDGRHGELYRGSEYISRPGLIAVISSVETFVAS